MKLAKQILSIIESASVYPEFPVPATDDTLHTLFAEFNQKYFGNELPEYRLKFVALATNFYGKHHIKYSKTTTQDRLITIAKAIQKAPKEIVDTLLHEMIHAWQYVEMLKTGDDKYLDLSWFDPIGERNLKGHGKYFKQEMDKLNGHGFNITITADQTDDVELVSPFYGLVFTSSVHADKCIALYSAEDPMGQLEKIKAIVDDVAGKGFMDTLVVVKTTCPVVINTTRLTGTWKLPRNKVNLWYDKDGVETYLVRSPLSHEIHREHTVEPVADKPGASDPGNIPHDVVQLLPQIHKYRGSDFADYLRTVIMNAKSLGLSTRDVPTGYLPTHGSIPVPDAVVLYVFNDWKQITDQEVRNSHDIGMLVNDLKYAIMSKRPLRPEDVASRYQGKFEPRMDKARFKKCVIDAFAAQLKKDAKKYGKEFSPKDAELVANALLKGTILEDCMTTAHEVLALCNEDPTDAMRQAWRGSAEFKQAQAIDGQIEGIRAKEKQLHDQLKKLQSDISGLEAKKGQLHKSFIQRHSFK